jgi:hypothetical protein
MLTRLDVSFVGFFTLLFSPNFAKVILDFYDKIRLTLT